MPTRNEATLVPMTAVVTRTTYLKLKGHLDPWAKNLRKTEKGAKLSDQVADALCLGRLLSCMVELLDKGEFELGELDEEAQADA